MTDTLPSWALREAIEVVSRWATDPDQSQMQHHIATALVSIAKAERERAAGICRERGKRIREIGDAPHAVATANTLADAILADGGPDAG